MFIPAFKILLKDCTAVLRGGRPVLLKDAPFPGSVPYLGIHTLQTGQILEYTLKELANISDQEDVLVVWDGSRCGLAFQGMYGAIGSTIVSLKPVGFLRDYLYYFIKSNFDFINKNSSGSGIPHVDPEIFFKLEIPYISLSAQQTVVDNIVNARNQSHILLQKQKEAVVNALSLTPVKYESADDINVIFSGFRDAILQAAISGDLTKDLDGIPLDQNPVVNREFSPNSSYRNMGTLPASWSWSSLGNVAVCQRGRFGARPRNDPKYFSGIYPFIQISEIPDEGGVIVAYRQTLNEQGKEVSKMFKKNTVVVAIVGSSIGNSGILGEDMYFPDSIVGISAFAEFDHEYIALYLQNEKLNIRGLAYSSGGQPNLKIEFINYYPIPCPPLRVQREIVKRVRVLLETYERVKSKYDASVIDFEQLEKSVLQNAFAQLYNDSGYSQSEVLTMLAKKKKAIENLRKEQLKYTRMTRTEMTKEILQVPLIGIEEVLMQTDRPMSAAQVLEASKYRNDIDGFYEALKHSVGKSIDWKVQQGDPSTPESILFLKKKADEN